ncbi:LCP family protein [Knoellia sp. p5-6-4]|uniref:LCP family protein n=1 Tax=unclassified Knoellia TaxID=2618719 RepID=UPI0023DCD935|nr:LCP family protein [Knoellia sp. p5-6-4]MDF2144862.1 LCP family protein [Knoellia sp. p5-6-4]
MSEATPGSEPSTPGNGGAAEETPQVRRRSDRHKDRRHPWLRRGGIAVAAGLAVALVLSVVAYVKLTGNINRLDLGDALGTRPEKQATTDSRTKLGPMNILVMGSDTRAGTGNSKYGSNNAEYGVAGARSDTNLVVHLSADRKSATVVSIPRDSMTRAPQNCADKEWSPETGVVRQWNNNFTQGGPGCVIKTFEGLTGIYLDHFVVIDFRGFERMVDALGGVTVCTPEPINDRDSLLTLPAGKTKVNGKQALGYVRVRKTVGDGSDIGRINRQQAFLSSVVQEATSSSLLLRPDRLFRFLDAATQSMTTDKGLGVGKMRDVAESVARIGMDQIRFVTVPIEDYPQDPNRVQWAESADLLWESLREDKPLPGQKPPPGSTPSPSPTTSAPLTVAPNLIRVRVTNDSGVPGLARQAAGALEVQGFRIDGFVNGTGTPGRGTVIRHGKGMEESARTVAAAFPGSKIRSDDQLGSTIEVSVGQGSKNVVEVPNRIGNTPIPSPTVTATAPPSSTATIKARTADQDICS